VSSGVPTSSLPLGPRTEADLEERLSRPTPQVLETLGRVDGDVVVLGAGGKMGPSLVGMIRRAVDAMGDGRAVLAVSRFSGAGGAQAVEQLEASGVRTVRADLTDGDAIAALPDAPNVIYMAGHKFGTSDQPALTWVTNTVVPALVAERYRAARLVAFSTGNVYPLTGATSRGSRESDPLAPIGEYAASCVGRERVLEYASQVRGTPVAIIRLNYAVDLRYGVLVDIALKVTSGTPIDLAMGHVNCIWQGDANAMAIRALEHASSPPMAINVTGPETLSVRDLALEIGRIVGREPRFIGREADDALLSDTTLAQSLFGLPSVPTPVLTAWVAEWVRHGGRTLGKATKFDARDGKF
jgi:nucleoside-diphosphate-sugar epimerase